MQRADDTIVAVSSPPGRSLRGLVRLTGRDAISILEALLTTSPDEPRALQQRHLQVRTADVEQASSTLTIPVMVACFPGPRSFTGQDVAELQCPGHPALLQRIVQAAVRLGARMAEPGEFTFRAFCSGRLDLTQAEGIAATIAATSDAQLQAAGLLREGELGQFAAGLVDDIASLLALVEAEIDFIDEEGVTAIAPADFADRLQLTRQKLRELLDRSRAWASLEDLPRIVIVGRPSTGKSTLFNALLGRQRAVISDMPGTTRDVLEEPIRLSDTAGRSVEAMLVDLAGLDEPRSALDEQVQQHAREALQKGDLLLHIDDGQSTPPHAANLSRLASLMEGKPTLAVRTKSDLPPAPAADTISVSALSGEGLARLRAELASHVVSRGISLGSEVLALQPRHEAALREALAQLDAASALADAQRDQPLLADSELLAGSLRAALDQLAGLGGQMTPDDVLGKVFATFCIGK